MSQTAMDRGFFLLATISVCAPLTLLALLNQNLSFLFLVRLSDFTRLTRFSGRITASPPRMCQTAIKIFLLCCYLFDSRINDVAEDCRH